MWNYLYTIAESYTSAETGLTFTNSQFRVSHVEISNRGKECTVMLFFEVPLLGMKFTEPVYLSREDDLTWNEQTIHEELLTHLNVTVALSQLS